MKTALVSTVAAILLGFATLANGRHFNATDMVSIIFVTGLVAWTLEEYTRTPHALTLARPIRLPANPRCPSHRKACRAACSLRTNG